MEFFSKENGRKVWYFGSLAAIYELWNDSLSYGESKITKYCVITKEIIYRKAHKTKKN